MAASIKCDERPFRGGGWGGSQKSGGSGGQRPPAKIFRKTKKKNSFKVPPSRYLTFQPDMALQACLPYQSEHVPRSIRATGRVGCMLDEDGTEHSPFGVDYCNVKVEIQCGRHHATSLDCQGFEFWTGTDIGAGFPSASSFEDASEVVKRFYPECEALIRNSTGAQQVFAFDHNAQLKAKIRR